jgi:DNA-binding beta-propeller fold protein YncE
VAARGYSLLYGSNGTAGDAFTVPSQSQAAGTVRFNSPRGLATMIIGGVTHLLIADTGNNCVREAIGDTVSVFAGLDCNPAGGTLLNGPQGVAASRRADPNPLEVYDVVIADDANNCLRWYTRGAGTVTTLTTDGLCGGAPGTANGGGTTARFNAPKDVVIDRARNAAYVAEYGNHSVRRIDLSTHTTTTLLGVPGTAGNDVTTTPADCLTPRHITSPHGLALSLDGTTLFVAGNDNNLPIQLNLLTNQCSRVGSAMGLFRHATVDFGGALLLTSTPNNVVVNVSNAAIVGSPLLNGVLLDAGLLSDGFDDPDGITVDPVNGDLFVTSSTKHTVMRVRH